MKRYRKISGVLFVLFITSGLYAQNDSCIFNKTVSVKNGSTLRMINKYGDINLINWKNDSLAVCATITITQENEVLRQKSIKLINISFDKINDTIQISTQYDKNFFSESNRDGRKRFSVDYLIKLPAFVNLNIVNEFGNISLDDISGTLAIKLSQGNLTARRLSKGNVKPVNIINVDHGKINIEELNWLSLTANNCPTVEIGKAQAIIINSLISRLRLGEIGSAIIDSKSDSYFIKTITNLNSQSVYSSIEAGILSGKLRSKAIFGSLKLSEIATGFNNVDITSSQSNIFLNTGQNTSFRADITTTNTSVEFPGSKYPNIKRTNEDKVTYILGTAGSESEPGSLIKINSTSGSLTFR